MVTRSSLIILFSLFSLDVLFTQSIGSTFLKFHSALQNKNYNFLEKQLDDKIIYTHSNAWVENKNSIISNLQSGYMNYQNIQLDSVRVNRFGNTAIIKAKANIQGVVNQNKFDIKLLILQTWKKKYFGRWKLISRSAVKTN